jgi:FixJ family two-component response regulator
MPDRCKLAGAVAFLVKPVMRDPLLDALKAALSAPDCADAQSRANS